MSWQFLHGCLSYLPMPGRLRWKYEWPRKGVQVESPHSVPTPKVPSEEQPLEGSFLLAILPVLALQALSD